MNSNPALHKPQPAVLPRLDYLDAARGIAAMMVLVYHFIDWRWNQTRWHHFASIAANGADAVSFFFVLSGFVLAYPYLLSDKTLKVFPFWIQRFFRLWPAFALTVLVSALYATRHEIRDHGLLWTFREHRTPLLEELSLFRGQKGFFGAGWTLTIELLLSFFMPVFLVLAAAKDRRLLPITILCILIMGQAFISQLAFQFGLGV